MNLEEKLKLVRVKREECINSGAGKSFKYGGRRFCPYNAFEFDCMYQNMEEVIMGYGGLYWGCMYEKTKTTGQDNS